MNKLNICIFGGTTEGRLLAEFLSKNNVQADLFIATEYGKQFVKDINNIKVYQKRLDEKQMVELFIKKKYDYVVDTTHPFAKIVSENIKKSTTSCNLKYIRVVREFHENVNCIYFDNIEKCVLYLEDKEGNILLTTGSKDLEKFTNVKNHDKRIYVRILPMESSLKKAIDFGYLNKNIICIQGPFSEELNVALINTTEAKYVVTKESSSSGGFEEKVQSCVRTGAECLVIRKPDESGLTLEELYNYFLSVF